MRSELFCALILCAVWALGCAGKPMLVDPATSGLFGELELVPRSGHGGAMAGDSSAYADRRYARADLVDYVTPGFAVVYLDPDSTSGATSEAASEPAPLTLTLERSLGRLHLEPGDGAMGRGGRLAFHNASGGAQTVTLPDLGLVRRIAPGATFAVTVDRTGELRVFVPSADASARVFVAPGDWTVVDDAGRYRLLGVAPGDRGLHVWHPRFPPAFRRVELRPGQVERIDLELGVGLEASGG